MIHEIGISSAKTFATTAHHVPHRRHNMCVHVSMQGGVTDAPVQPTPDPARPPEPAEPFQPRSLAPDLTEQTERLESVRCQWLLHDPRSAGTTFTHEALQRMSHILKLFQRSQCRQNMLCCMCLIRVGDCTNGHFSI